MTATLTPQRIAITGHVPVLAAATALGDTVKPGSTTFLWVDNADAGPHVVTLNDPRTALGVVGGASGVVNSDLDLAITVANGAFKLIAVPERFKDPDTGLASISYDGVTSVTVGAFKLPVGDPALTATGTLLATQKITPSGLTVSFTAAANGQKVKPGARSFLLVKNGHSSAKTITLDDPTSVSPVGATAFNPDVAVVVANATVYSMIGPVDSRFTDTSDTNRADISWSALTSTSIAVLSI